MLYQLSYIRAINGRYNSITSRTMPAPFEKLLLFSRLFFIFPGSWQLFRLKIIARAVLPASAERETKADRRIETVCPAALKLQLYGEQAALGVQQVKRACHSVKVLALRQLKGPALGLLPA